MRPYLLVHIELAEDFGSVKKMLVIKISAMMKSQVQRNLMTKFDSIE